MSKQKEIVGLPDANVDWIKLVDQKLTKEAIEPVEEINAYAKTVDTRVHVTYKKVKHHPTFIEMVVGLRDEFGISAEDFLKRAMISKSTISDHMWQVIFNMKSNTQLRLVLALRLPKDQARQLLSEYAHNYLDVETPRDALICFAIDHRLTIDETNKILENAGEKNLLDS